MLKLLLPDLRVDTVLDLTPQRLAVLEVRGLLLDVDCTLKRYRAAEVLPEVAAWIDRLRTSDIRMCLVSNGHNGRIARFAQPLGLPFVAMAMKPLPVGCWRATRKLDLPRRQTAMVGDQLFADVVAGKLAGVKTILVKPIHPEDEPWFTRLKRPLERWVLAREQSAGGCDRGSEPQEAVVSDQR